MCVFDGRQRVDLGPANHGEPHWAYLDRSARAEFAAARDRINVWCSRLPDETGKALCRRMRSGDDHEFASAFWELFLHEMFTGLGCDVICEPVLPSGRRIDFLVSLGETSMLVEATIARSSDAARAADARRNRVYRELDQVKIDGFMLGIEIEAAGSGDLPNVGDLRRRLEEWLAGLDPDAVLHAWDASENLPSFHWERAGWDLTVEAYPLKPERRGTPVQRPLGSFMDETGGTIDDETPLRRALRRKAAARYGTFDRPYVIAVSEFSFAHDDDADWHRSNVFFGQEAIAFGYGNPARSIRKADGYWRGPGQRPRNRRTSAVLLSTHLQPWSAHRAVLEWWDHPFAALPVPNDLVPATVRRRQLVFKGSEGTLDTSEPSRSLDSVMSSG